MKRVPIRRREREGAVLFERFDDASVGASETTDSRRTHPPPPNDSRVVYAPFAFILACLNHTARHAGGDSDLRGGEAA